MRKYIMVRKHRTKNMKLNVILALRYADVMKYESRTLEAAPLLLCFSRGEASLIFTNRIESDSVTPLGFETKKRF